MNRLRKIGVLDDERIAVDGLVKLLEKLLPGVEVKGFQYHNQFLAWADVAAPELVFLDMEMPAASGLDIARKVKDKVGNIVFVTAHSEYSLDAFETAVDYILKPVAPSRVKKCLEKIGNLYPIPVHEERTVRLPIRGSFTNVPEKDIIMLRGQRNYTEVVLTNGEHHLVARTLKSFSEGLSERFWRVHKSVIVRSDAVVQVIPGSKPQLELVSGQTVEASKTRLNELGVEA